MLEISVLLKLLGSFALGALAWLLTHYVAGPILELRRLRQAVHEELLYTANIGWVNFNGRLAENEKGRHDQAVRDVRRLAAKISALAATWPWVARWYLIWPEKLDLSAATTGLIGLSNSIDPAHRVQFRTQTETALRLPRSYSDETTSLVKRARRMKG